MHKYIVKIFFSFLYKPYAYTGLLRTGNNFKYINTIVKIDFENNELFRRGIE